MTNTTKKFSVNEFEDLLQQNTLVLVDFFATWCGPCKMFAPIVEQVSKKYAGTITVLQLDVDENEEIAGKYIVQSVPTLILFKNGTAVERTSGAQTLAQCSALIDKHL